VAGETSDLDAGLDVPDSDLRVEAASGDESTVWRDRDAVRGTKAKGSRKRSAKCDLEGNQPLCPTAFKTSVLQRSTD
jgi:hypothetical protein